MTFFTDRDLGVEFAKILRAAGLQVEVHRDHFAPEATDDVWLPQAASQGWIILTSDQKMLRRDNEVAAIRRSCASVFILIGGHSPTPELAENFINTLAHVEAMLEAETPPFAAKVYRPNPVGKVVDGKPGRVERKL